MTMPLSYAFQPQPPSHPKTTGGKRAPSGPISIPSSSSSNEDDDSDTSITDFSPPLPSRFVCLETSSSPNSKPSVLPLSNLPSPRSHITNKKSSLHYSPRSLNSNNNNSNILGTGSSCNTNVYPLTSLTNGHASSNSVGGVHSNDVICPTIPTQGSTQGLATTNISLLNSLNTPPSSSQSHSTPSLPKTHPPSISIPLSCSSNANSSSIPSISNSALSPTIPTQNSNSNSSKNNNSSNSSSHDSSKENSCPSSSSPRNRSCSPSSTFAYEHDHDYENVASPCSSTASGPIYVRPPGFQHHAHEVLANKVKKKKTSSNPIDVREGLKKREPTPPKLKPKRGSIPMKLRALPQSFWQQPNMTQQVSPATMFPILPPLCNKDTEEDMDERPTTPPEDKEETKRVSERKITVANTDLLFKLFENIGEEKKSGQTKSKQINRVKKAPPTKTSSHAKGLFMGKDPFLMEDVTQKIFPQLTLEGSKHGTAVGAGNTSLQLVTLREGDRTVTFPSLSTNEQNYPQLLSELVMHI